MQTATATTRPRVRQGRSSRALTVVALTLGYVAILHFAYQQQIAPYFYYLRYTYRDPEPLAYGLAILLVVALALLLPRRIKQPSHFMLWILFVVLVAPSLIISQIADVLTVPRAIEMDMWVAVSFALVAVLGTRRVLRGTIPLVGLSSPAFWVVLCAVSGLIYIYIFAAVGFRAELPSLDDVYTVRDEFSTVAVTSGLLAYLVPLQANVLNPLMMVRGLYKRQWTWLIAGLLGQIYVYSFTGFKTAIFSPIAVVLVYLLFRYRYRPGGAAIMGGAVGTVAAVLIIDWIARSNDVTSLLVRRFLVTPGLLTAGYVDVFSDLEKAWLSYSIFEPFFSYPYLQEPPLLVGAAFFGSPSTNANASFLADGFANFGYGGMIAECLVLVVVLWLVDDAARSIPVGVSSMIFLMPTLALAESGILTTLLTHGLFAAIVICLFVSRTGWAKPKRVEYLPTRDGPRRTAPPEKRARRADIATGQGR